MKKVLLIFVLLITFQLLVYIHFLWQRRKLDVHYEQIDRISFCSLREFSGRTTLGTYACENTVAVSRDLKQYLGYMVRIHNNDYFVSDLTHKRFNKTIDIYVDLSKKDAMKLGIIESPTTVKFYKTWEMVKD